MALSVTGVLAIVVLALALVVVLLGMTFRVKKLKSELKVRQDDNITPFISTVSHYKDSNFDVDTKINALNKVSKQFFRELFKFSSEKTFDEISSLASDPDIKKFCTDMGVIRYSKNLGLSDIDNLYKSFIDILVKRKPRWADNSSVVSKKMTVDDLMNRKMKKDIADIKHELGKMSLEPLIQASQPAPQPVIQPAPSQIVVPSTQEKRESVDAALARIIEDIDSHASKVEEQVVRRASAPTTARTTTAISVASKKVVSPNKVIGNLVKNAPLIKPARVVSASQVRQARYKSGSKLIKRPLTSLKINPDDDSINQEITGLNSRLQRLLDEETNKRLSDVGRGRY